MRNLVHIIVSIAMWCLFGYYWHVVLGRDVGDSALRALAILGLTVLGGLLITMAWVEHNLRLARKFGSRRSRTPSADDPALEQDSIGRGIVHPGLDALRAAQIVDIEADGEHKTYRVAGEAGRPAP